mmetsp:Transcript_1385/g.3196  ORF Transcript_1385/g.3196 Transcript_1385/m.3196 type:complete len:609 (+) Transcript_1385:85-1911(+)
MTGGGLAGRLRRFVSRSSADDDDGGSSKDTGSASVDDEGPEGEVRDEMFARLKREAEEVVRREPILAMLLSRVGLIPPDPKHPQSPGCPYKPARTFEEVISRIVTHRLSTCSGGSSTICPDYLYDHILAAFMGNELECGHTMAMAVREDARAIIRRDPACETLLEAVLFMKGFLSLVLHRAARRAWKPDGAGGGASGSRFLALLLQSQASSAFGVDIHPAASIGCGVMFDHATGVVIGETATVGDNTTILHGVTLGGTGKENGDRHPKIGRDVLIGAGTKILGNITVGDRAKIGALSVVLRPIPGGATAVGSPARIIGFVPKEERPGSSNDVALLGVESLVGSLKRQSGSMKLEVAREDSVEEDGESQVGLEVDDDSDEAGDADEAAARSSPTKRIDSSGTSETDPLTEPSGSNAGTSSSSDDDSAADAGTPAERNFVKVAPGDSQFCPFTDVFSKFAKKDTELSSRCIGHGQLRDLLLNEGCTEGECVEVFFALLHAVDDDSPARRCGCIPPETFYGHFPSIAREKTKLDREKIEALASGDLKALSLSKKASRKFKCLFASLGKQAKDGVARASCSSSYADRDMRKSDRDRMMEHVDTANFCAEITM